MSVPANFFDTYTIVASPATTAEIVIGSLDGTTELLPGLPVNLEAWCNVTPDAATTTITFRIRRDSLTGAQVGISTSNGPGSVTGASVGNPRIECADTPSNFAGRTYVLTLAMAAAAGAATVNALHLSARVG